jgi:hypothetical protein
MYSDILSVFDRLEFSPHFVSGRSVLFPHSITEKPEFESEVILTTGLCLASTFCLQQACISPLNLLSADRYSAATVC